MKEEVNKSSPKTAAKPQSSKDSSSSDEEYSPADTLTSDDIKEIKKLIKDQEKEIDTLKEQSKMFKDKLIYQLAENENTIKRYKKEIDSTREYAISKFAKDLLEVKDNLERGNEYIVKLKVEEQKDLEELKKHFV